MLMRLQLLYNLFLSNMLVDFNLVGTAAYVHTSYRLLYRCSDI